MRSLTQQLRFIFGSQNLEFSLQLLILSIAFELILICNILLIIILLYFQFNALFPRPLLSTQLGAHIPAGQHIDHIFVSLDDIWSRCMV